MAVQLIAELSCICVHVLTGMHLLGGGGVAPTCSLVLMKGNLSQNLSYTTNLLKKELYLPICG